MQRPEGSFFDLPERGVDVWMVRTGASSAALEKLVDVLSDDELSGRGVSRL